MTSDFALARLNMVENQVRTNDVTDLDIQDAMRVVERETLCPPEKRYLAYAEAPVEYQPGWYMMQPRDISKLLQAILPRPGEQALAIAAPYAAAVLRKIGLAVDTREAGEDLKAAVDTGPYTVIVSEAAVWETPKAWRDALAVGGRMAVVERRGPVGKARLYTRGEDGLIAEREIFDATPPLAPGFQPEPSFAF
jgi:protein-L-isoaspartate(D-aspartate) O-methyltransferase